MHDLPENQSYQVDVSGLIRQGWELLRKDMGLHIVLLLLIWVVSAVVSAIPGLSILVGIASAPLAAGSLIIALKRAQGQEPKLEDGLLGLERFVPLFLVGLVTSVLISLGFMLLIIPGIYLTVAYLLAFPLVVDRDMPFWDAMETSRKVITRKWFPVFLLVLALTVINLIGCIPMGLGLLITIPLTFATIVVFYETVCGIAGELPVKGKVLGSIGFKQ